MELKSLTTMHGEACLGWKKNNLCSMAMAFAFSAFLQGWSHRIVPPGPSG